MIARLVLSAFFLVATLFPLLAIAQGNYAAKRPDEITDAFIREAIEKLKPPQKTNLDIILDSASEGLVEQLRLQAGQQSVRGYDITQPFSVNTIVRLIKGRSYEADRLAGADYVMQVGWQPDGTGRTAVLSLRLRDPRTNVETLRVERPAITFAAICETPTLEKAREVANKDDPVFLADLNHRIDAAVRNRWTTLGLTQTIRSAIAIAGEEQRKNTNIFRELWRGFSPEEAKKAAESILRSAFEDQDVKTALDALARSVTEDVAPLIGKRIELVVERTVDCIRATTSATDLSPVGRVFNLELERAIAAGRIKLGNVNLEHAQHMVTAGGTVVGVSALILRQVSRRIGAGIAQQVTGRIGSRIASRLIPFVGVLVLAYDIFDLARGGPTRSITQMLIAEDKVYSQTSALVSDTLKGEFKDSYVNQIAGVVGQLVDGYRTVASQYSGLIELARADQSVSALLASLAPSQLIRLREVAENVTKTDLITAVASREIVRPLDAPDTLYQPFLTVLGHTRKFSTAEQWRRRAGTHLPQTAKLRIHEKFAVAEVSEQLLGELLRLPEPAISVIARLPSDLRLPVISACSHYHLVTLEKLDVASFGRTAKLLQLSNGHECGAASVIGKTPSVFDFTAYHEATLQGLPSAQRRATIKALSKVDFASAAWVAVDSGSPSLARRYAIVAYGPIYFGIASAVLVLIWFFGGEFIIWLKSRAARTGQK